VGDAQRYDIARWGWVLVIGGFEVIEEMKLLKSKGVGENDFYWKFQLTRRMNGTTGGDGLFPVANWLFCVCHEFACSQGWATNSCQWGYD
jgi:hypothetical protein